MKRTFDPQDFVAAPLLDASSAIALGSELLTAAKAEKKLPPRVGKSRDRLGARHAVLRARRVEFTASLRDYVLQVVANVDQEDPTTAQLAERLLNAYANWESRARNGATASAPPAPADPPKP